MVRRNNSNFTHIFGEVNQFLLHCKIILKDLFLLQSLTGRGSEIVNNDTGIGMLEKCGLAAF